MRIGDHCALVGGKRAHPLFSIKWHRENHAAVHAQDPRRMSIKSTKLAQKERKNMHKDFRVENSKDFEAVEAFVCALLRCEPRGGCAFLRSEAFLRLRMCAIYQRMCAFPVTAWLHVNGLSVSLESRGIVRVVDDNADIQ